MYSMSLSHTLSAVMFSRKQKRNPRMSGGRRNVSSSLGQKKKQSEETQHWKGSGSKVMSLLWTVHFKISDLGRHSCLNSGQTSTFLFSPKHPNLCDSSAHVSLLPFVRDRCAHVFTASVCLPANKSYIEPFPSEEPSEDRVCRGLFVRQTVELRSLFIQRKLKRL